MFITTVHTLIGVTWLVTLEGGRQNRSWTLGNFNEGVQLERWEDWFELLLNKHTHLAPTHTQWRTQEFFRGGGGQQIKLGTEGRENGDLSGVAP
jgi:hypothetical protein